MTIKTTAAEFTMLRAGVDQYRATPEAFENIPEEFITALDHLLTDWSTVETLMVDLGKQAQDVLETWKKNGIIKT